jgi:hypothetical protein
MTGESNSPTALPTAKPILNTAHYSNSLIYKSYQTTYANLNSLTSYSIYAMLGFFYFKEIQPSYCTDWQEFSDKRLVTFFKNIKFVSATAVYQYAEITGSGGGNLSTTCSDPVVISGVISMMQANANFHMMCNGHKWRVASCAQGPVFCIDCIEACKACPGSSFVNNPCIGQCPSQLAAFSVLRFDAVLVVLYPQILSTAVRPKVVRGSNTVTANITVSGVGLVACTVIPSSTILTSINTVLNGPLSIKRYLNGPFSNISMTFYDLIEATEYSLYCYTRDNLGNDMSFSTMRTALQVFKSPGAPKIVLSTIPSNNSVSEPIFISFGLTSLPSISVITIQISATVCSQTQNSLNLPDILPSSFYFGSTDMSLSQSFSLLSKYTGCFILNLTDTSNTYRSIISRVNFFSKGSIVSIS